MKPARQLFDAGAEDAVRQILLGRGENPDRPGLQKTPARVARALRFLTEGYATDPAAILQDALYDSEVDEMVLVKDVEFYSICEHHLLPFYGQAHIAYVPDGRIAGLSKLPRVVDALSRRLQVQEDLTIQVAKAIQEALRPKGVGVVMQAHHLCMMMRGVQKQNSRAVTSCMLGSFKKDARTRSEFLQLIKGDANA
jgi:GTP cyclohydrolase I